MLLAFLQRVEIAGIIKEKLKLTLWPVTGLPALNSNFRPGVSSTSHYKLYARIFRNWQLKDMNHTFLYFWRGGNRAPEICNRLLHWEICQDCIWRCTLKWSGICRPFITYYFVAYWGFRVDKASHWSWSMGTEQHLLTVFVSCRLFTL